MPAATASIGRALPPELQQQLAQLTEVSTLPEITTRIVEVVENPRATARDMHDVVRTDPGLAAKVLRVVNSAFYGLSARVASLDRAILLLGLGAVKNIALAASLARMFKAESVSQHVAVRDLWRHSMAVGVGAKLMATAGAAVPTDEAFVAGLVHDMGLLALQQLYADKMRTVVDHCSNQPCSLIATEQEIIGADHQAFGAALAARWRFPASLLHVLAGHHEPTAVPPEFVGTTSVVYVADTLCCRARLGFFLSARTQTLTDELLDRVRLSSAALEAVSEKLLQAVEEVERLFAD